MTAFRNCTTKKRIFSTCRESLTGDKRFGEEIAEVALVLVKLIYP